MSPDFSVDMSSLAHENSFLRAWDSDDNSFSLVNTSSSHIIFILYALLITNKSSVFFHSRLTLEMSSSFDPFLDCRGRISLFALFLCVWSSS